jgi:hypothetical protein
MQLAHGDLSKAEKAFYCADLFTGRRCLADHTVAGLARYVGINPTLVHWALKQEANRDAIIAGLLPLVPPPGPAVKAERMVARLINELGHARVAELLARFAPAPIAEPANDNSPPREGEPAAVDSAA